MQVNCPKCGSSLEDQHGSILTKCRKCGLDGEIAMKMSYLKNEHEIDNQEGESIASWNKDEKSKPD